MSNLLDLKCKLEAVRELIVVFGCSASLGDVEQALYNDVFHLVSQKMKKAKCKYK